MGSKIIMFVASVILTDSLLIFSYCHLLEPITRLLACLSKKLLILRGCHGSVHSQALAPLATPFARLGLLIL